MGRRKARDVAFKYVYATIYGKSEQEKLIDSILTAEEEASSLDKDESEFFEYIVNGIEANSKNIDEKIYSKLKGWNEERIFRVDLALLKLAVFEVLYATDERYKVPYKVAINEAVQLSKKYGTDTSKNFINGVLKEIVNMDVENK